MGSILITKKSIRESLKWFMWALLAIGFWSAYLVDCVVTVVDRSRDRDTDHYINHNVFNGFVGCDDLFMVFSELRHFYAN
jgi:hypothetical protein